MVKNEYDGLELDCQKLVIVNNQETYEDCDPVGDLNIDQTMWESILYLGIIMLGYRLVALIALKLLSRRHSQK